MTTTTARPVTTQPLPASARGGARSPDQRCLRYAYMKLARGLDERFEALRLTGRVSKWYSSVGNEATTVPAGLALLPGDALCTLHRDLGAIVATYCDPARTFPSLGLPAATGALARRSAPELLLRRLACQLLGREGGFSRGIERSFHYGYFEEDSELVHVGMISHLGAMIPVAAGCGFALRQRGGDRVAINFIGEGGTSTGDFHEALNMAAVWKLPFVLVIENNRYAFSTPVSGQYVAARLADRGAGYGIPAEQIDGNDPDAAAQAIAAAVARARAGAGPTLIEAMVGRMRGHSEGDDSLKVVPEPEQQRYLDEDPVPRYASRLLAEGAFAPGELDQLHQRVAELVESAIDAALEAPAPPPEVARRPVYAPLAERPAGAGAGRGGAAPSPLASDQPTSYVDAIRRALYEAMAEDEGVVLMGQDIGAFEGAFRVTTGLHARWPTRVLDTPISESGTIGIAAGAALLGLRPVVEMQFADFVSCGFNQIANVLAKLYYRFERPCPVVLRLPSGGGVGAGAFHSQNPEGWFAHIAGLKVVCPATARDAYALLRAALRDRNPVVFCEHKFLYRRIKEVLPAHDPLERLGVAQVLRPGRQVSLIGYGATTWTNLEAADQLAREGIECEVVDLRTLVPFDRDTVLHSVKKTGRALVAHEAQLTGGFGGEVAAQIAEHAFAWLDAPVRRIAYPDRPVPYAKNLEKELLPSAAAIVAAVRELVAF